MTDDYLGTPNCSEHLTPMELAGTLEDPEWWCPLCALSPQATGGDRPSPFGGPGAIRTMEDLYNDLPQSRAVPADQVAALVNKIGPEGDVVLFLAYTGLRWGEMAGLRVKRLDMLRRRVDVAEAITEPNGVITWGTPKSHARRSVPFPDFLSVAIAQRCEGKSPGDTVFSSPAGAVLRVAGYRRRKFDTAVAALIAEDSTFPNITPHDLRHTAASLAVSAGAHVKAVQRMLGHASAAMTLDVYADLFDDDLDAVAEALNEKAALANVGKMWAAAAANSAP